MLYYACKHIYQIKQQICQERTLNRGGGCARLIQTQNENKTKHFLLAFSVTRVQKSHWCLSKSSSNHSAKPSFSRGCESELSRVDGVSSCEWTTTSPGVDGLVWRGQIQFKCFHIFGSWCVSWFRISSSPLSHQKSTICHRPHLHFHPPTFTFAKLRLKVRRGLEGSFKESHLSKPGCRKHNLGLCTHT